MSLGLYWNVFIPVLILWAFLELGHDYRHTLGHGLRKELKHRIFCASDMDCGIDLGIDMVTVAPVDLGMDIDMKQGLDVVINIDTGSPMDPDVDIDIEY